MGAGVNLELWKAAGRAARFLAQAHRLANPIPNRVDPRSAIKDRKSEAKEAGGLSASGHGKNKTS